ncbi:hypothetical protein [Gracilibacillus sp. YIM 98692]|uniref:hypothetical protein n=1 Tax=Gracilibacillus sp. YIM 98692 TaxID=2663532 RepID=UPI0013D39CB1|nr:hypothetical protein [Gracilibacillus sp. YIM 98692]
MGYIMPIQHTTYQQYQKRVTRDQPDPFIIEKLYPVPFNMQYKREEQHQAKTPTSSSTPRKHPNNTLLYQTNHFKAQEKWYAEITGKGRKFQAKI